MFIRSATSTAGPRTSTGLPLERSEPLRSTTVAEWLGNPAAAPYVTSIGLFLWLMLITAVLEIVMTARGQYLLARKGDTHTFSQ